MCVCVGVSCSVVSDSLRPHGLWPTRLLCPWSKNTPGKNTGVDSHSLLQGFFPIQGLNLVSCITDRLLPKPVITLRITKWWNFNVFISSTFVSWHPYVKMSFSFFPLSFSSLSRHLFLGSLWSYGFLFHSVYYNLSWLYSFLMPKLSKILPLGTFQVLCGMASLVFLVQQAVPSSLVLFSCPRPRINCLKELWFF